MGAPASTVLCTSLGIVSDPGDIGPIERENQGDPPERGTDLCRILLRATAGQQIRRLRGWDTVSLVLFSALSFFRPLSSVWYLPLWVSVSIPMGDLVRRERPDRERSEDMKPVTWAGVIESCSESKIQSGRVVINRLVQTLLLTQTARFNVTPSHSGSASCILTQTPPFA